MFCHNSTIHSATRFQPYQLVYGHSLTVPTSLLTTPEPQYNYDDYQYEFKKTDARIPKHCQKKPIESEE